MNATIYWVTLSLKYGAEDAEVNLRAISGFLRCAATRVGAASIEMTVHGSLL
jgi:hypothetical protein